MTPEGKVKIRVRSILNRHGVYSHSPVQNGMGRPSLDFICCAKGRYFAVETKAPGNHLTPRQELTKKQIESAGGKVFVVGESQVGSDGGEDFFVYSGENELEAWLLGLL